MAVLPMAQFRQERRIGKAVDALEFAIQTGSRQRGTLLPPCGKQISGPTGPIGLDILLAATKLVLHNTHGIGNP